MQIIDMHTHTFPNKIAEKTLEKLSGLSGTIPYTDGTEDGLALSMKEAGISYSLMLPVATSAGQVKKINDGVIDCAARRREKGLFSFGAMHPDFEEPEKELRRLKEAGILGIKLHPTYVNRFFDDKAFLPILQAAAACDLAVTVHAGIDISLPGQDFCSTEMILEMLEKAPGVKLILAHMGGWGCWEKVRRDLAGAPMYYDTSFSIGTLEARADRAPDSVPELMTDAEFVSLCRQLGFDRILFGTDSPWANQKDIVKRIQAMPFTEEEKERIFCKNAKKLLHLK